LVDYNLKSIYEAYDLVMETLLLATDTIL